MSGWSATTLGCDRSLPMNSPAVPHQEDAWRITVTSGDSAGTVTRVYSGPVPSAHPPTTRPHVMAVTSRLFLNSDLAVSPMLISNTIMSSHTMPRNSVSSSNSRYLSVRFGSATTTFANR